MANETPIPPLGAETIRPAEQAPYDEHREHETTRRFYILLLGLIVVASLIAVVIMTLDDPDIDIVGVMVLGGVAVGALASLAANDRR